MGGVCRRLQPNSSGTPTVFSFCSAPGNLRWGFVADFSPAPRNVQWGSAADFSPNPDLNCSWRLCSKMQPDSEEPPTLLCRGLQPNSAERLLRSRSAAAHSRRSFPAPTATHRSSTSASTRERSAPRGASVRDARSSLRFLRCLPMASNGAAPCPPLPAFPLAPAPAPPPRGCEPSSALLLLFFSPPLPRRTRGRGTHHYPLPARTLRGRALNGALRLIYGESPVYSRPQGGS